MIHALDHVWEVHKPYLQKSWFLSGLVRKAEMEGVNNIIDEDEEAETMTCKMYSNHVQKIILFLEQKLQKRKLISLLFNA